MLDEIINYVQSLQQQVEVRKFSLMLEILGTVRVSLKEVFGSDVSVSTLLRFFSPVFVYETCDCESRSRH